MDMEDKATLARIEERTVNILKRLDQGDNRMDSIETKIDSGFDKVDTRLYSLPCQTEHEKIKTLERIAWGSIGTAAAAAFGMIWQFVVAAKTAVKP